MIKNDFFAECMDVCQVMHAIVIRTQFPNKKGIFIQFFAICIVLFSLFSKAKNNVMFMMFHEINKIPGENVQYFECNTCKM